MLRLEYQSDWCRWYWCWQCSVFLRCQQSNECQGDENPGIKVSPSNVFGVVGPGNHGVTSESLSHSRIGGTERRARSFRVFLLCIRFWTNNLTDRGFLRLLRSRGWLMNLNIVTCSQMEVLTRVATSRRRRKYLLSVLSFVELNYLLTVKNFLKK